MNRKTYDFAFKTIEFIDFLYSNLEESGLLISENSELNDKLGDLRADASSIIFDTLVAGKEITTTTATINLCGESYTYPVDCVKLNNRDISSDDLWDLIFTASTKEAQDNLWKEFIENE